MAKQPPRSPQPAPSRAPAPAPESAPDSARFLDAASAFVASRSSPNTREAYRRDLDAWLDFCAEQDANPAAPTLALATAYRDSLLKSLSTESLRRKLAVLSAVYRGALEQEKPAATWNPFSVRALPRPAGSRYGRTEAAPEDVAQAMLDAARADTTDTGARDAAVLALLYATGLRRVSVASIRRENVFRRGDVLVVRTAIKGGEEVEVEVPTPYSLDVQRWYKVSAELGKSVWLFPGRDPREHLSLQMLNKVVNFWAAAVGAEGIHPHCFRVSFVTGLYDAGAHERDIQAAVHHRDPRSTQRYDRGRRGSGATELLAEHRRKRT
jgi:site-specific recombinase XerD